MIIEITPAELNENESQRRFLSYRLHTERFIASRLTQAISDAGMDHGHCSIVRLPQCDDSIRYSVQEVVQEAEQVHPHTQAPQIPRPSLRQCPGTTSTSETGSVSRRHNARAMVA